MTLDEINKKLHEVAELYPEHLIQKQKISIPRIAFHISVIVKNHGPNCKVCDLGGGVGLFSVGCAAVGMDTTLVDDFRDNINLEYGDQLFQAHKKVGVKIISKNIIEDCNLGFETNSFDAITTFDSMEHWHDSPKKLFHNVITYLKDGGTFLLGVPNCVNLRKRISVPFGYGKWSSMEEWYEIDSFRGHVREPDIDDLKYIGQDMGLKNIQIIGKNWQGYYSPSKLKRAITPFIDIPLRIFPQLCADIYLVGRK